MTALGAGGAGERPTIDLNCDLGEGFGAWRMGDDDALLHLVTSANVACGFHGGDPRTMDRTVAAALERGVAIGAHVSYYDLRGFGRRRIPVSDDELATDVLYQIGALEAIASSHGGRVRYVKAHGALYNDSAADAHLADVLVGAIARYGADLAIVGLPESAVARAAASAGIRWVREGFADRSYEPDGSLSPRSSVGAVITDPEVVARRATRLVSEQRLTSCDGSELALEVDTICIHGDTPGAPELASRVRAALEAAGVALRPFSV